TWVRCRGKAAIFLWRSRDDDGIDSPLAKDNVEVRAKKAAVAMLLNNMLAGGRRQLRINLNTRRAINQCVTICDGRVHVIKQSHIGAVAAVDLCRVNDFDSSVAAD